MKTLMMVCLCLCLTACGSSSRAQKEYRYLYEMTVIMQSGTGAKPIALHVSSDMTLEEIRWSIRSQGYFVGQSQAYFDDNGHVVRAASARDMRLGCTILAGEKAIGEIKLLRDAQAIPPPDPTTPADG